MKKMTAKKIAITSVLSGLGIIILCTIFGYNDLIKKQQEVIQRKSNIETQLQRRMDLIPNLINTVKGYASHEEKIFKEVSAAREKLAASSTLSQKAGAESELTSALNRLIAIKENYPNLKADTQFTALQDELSGTENRVQVARKDYNDAAKKYNQSTKTFPSVIIAAMFGFKEAEYFEADQGAKTVVPKVEF